LLLYYWEKLEISIAADWLIKWENWVRTNAKKFEKHSIKIFSPDSSKLPRLSYLTVNVITYIQAPILKNKPAK
jgi:hypothetical protein